MCWAEEQRGEEASEESTSDGCLTGCGNTPFHSLVWQKNKHRATKLSLSLALMDKRWLFPNKTDWPAEKRETRTGQWDSAFRTWHCCALVSWSTGPCESLLQFSWVSSHLALPVPWQPPTWPDGRKVAPISWATPAQYFDFFVLQDKSGAVTPKYQVKSLLLPLRADSMHLHSEYDQCILSYVPGAMHFQYEKR